MERLLLLNPGPVTLSERVRAALTRPDLCHREEEFAHLTRSILTRLVRVYPTATDYRAVMVSGSGTCAVEAMINTFAPPDSTTLVVANGVYGERIAAMLAAADRPHHLLDSGWSEPVDLAAVREVLARQRFTHLAVVHNETTTGRLNPLDGLAALCHEFGCDLLIDAVSSFGGEALDLATWKPLAVAATANKCLHSVPGVAFVLVRNERLEQTSHASTLYLDLLHYEHTQRSGYSPFTPAVHATFALDAALDELAEQGGWQARHQRYHQLSTALRTALQEIGIRCWLPAAAYSAMISSFHLPHGWDYRRLHDLLREAGYVIYAGQGDLSGALFRIANMGAISDDDWQRLIDIFRTQVAESGGG